MLNDILDRHMAAAHAIPHTGHLSKKILYAKLIYCNHLSKQKFGFNKNKSNDTFTIF